MTAQATVTERPILFSSPMVQAILAGKKHVTRRVVKPHPYKVEPPDDGCGWRWEFSKRAYAWNTSPDALGRGMVAHCPYGLPGHRLWVREKHSLCKGSSTPAGSHDASYCCFPDGSQSFKKGGYYHWDKPVTGTWPKGHRWRSSIHMPRWASRVTLEITEVRAERLGSITEEDAIAEGLSRITKDDGRTWKYGIPDHDGLPGGCDVGWPWHDWDVDPRKAYARLWDEINGEKHPWSSNCWVWVIAFKRLGPTS